MSAPVRFLALHSTLSWLRSGPPPRVLVAFIDTLPSRHEELPPASDDALVGLCAGIQAAAGRTTSAVALLASGPDGSNLDDIDAQLTYQALRTEVWSARHAVTCRALLPDEPRSAYDVRAAASCGLDDLVHRWLATPPEDLYPAIQAEILDTLARAIAEGGDERAADRARSEAVDLVRTQVDATEQPHVLASLSDAWPDAPAPGPLTRGALRRLERSVLPPGDPAEALRRWMVAVRSFDTDRLEAVIDTEFIVQAELLGFGFGGEAWDLADTLAMTPASCEPRFLAEPGYSAIAIPPLTGDAPDHVLDAFDHVIGGLRASTEVTVVCPRADPEAPAIDADGNQHLFVVSMFRPGPEARWRARGWRRLIEAEGLGF